MLIPKNLGTLFTWDYNLKVAIGIEVSSNNVQPNSSSFSGNMLSEDLELFIPSVVHDDGHIVGTWISAVMSINTLAGDKFVNTVTVQIREVKRVCAGP